MASYLNICRFRAASAGTGSFVVASAVAGYRTPANAGATGGATYRYRAENVDLTQWEIGTGVYTVSTATLTRTVIANSDSSATAVNFTNAPQVGIVLLKEDVDTFLVNANNLSDVSSAATARTNLGVAIGTNVQAWDTDLDALAGLSTTGLVARTGAGTASTRIITGPAAGITVSNGDGVSGNPTLALANDLAAYEGLATTGLVARTADGAAATRTLSAPAAGITVSNGDGVSGNPTLALADDLAALEGMGGAGLAARTATNSWTARTLTAPAAGFTITNPAGVAGNPTFVLANDLAALEALASTGIAVRSATDMWVQRSIAGTANEITATNGDGVSGNPTLSLPAALTFTGKTVTGGTFSGPTLTSAAVSNTIDLVEIASPSNPAADNLRVFAKDVAGTTHLFTRDSGGAETDLNAGAAGVSAATQAEEEAASSTSVYSSPGRQQYHPGHPKGWVAFDGTGTPTASASYNHSSITDVGTGLWTLNHTTAFSSAANGVLFGAAQADQSSSVNYGSVGTDFNRAASAVSAGFATVGAGVDATSTRFDAKYMMCSFYGDQA